MKRWLLVTALAALIQSAAAQDFKAEWEGLVAAAEKEGALTMYALPNPVIRDFVVQEWTAAFPKIPISATVMPHTQFIARIRTERSADKFLWDVAYTGPESGYILYHEGVVDPLLPELVDPTVKDAKIWGGWEDGFLDEAGKYVFAPTAYLSSVWYNAEHVPPDKVKRLGTKVILEPEYVGKMAWHDPTILGAGQVSAQFMRMRLGDDGLRKLFGAQKVQLPGQQQQVVEAMARNIAWFGLGPPVKQLLQPYTSAGVRTDVRSLGNSPEVATLVVGVGLFTFNKRPHPAASRLFVNWLMSKDIGVKMAKVRGQNSRRIDVPSVTEPDETPLPGAKYYQPQREESIAKIGEAAEFIKAIRGEAR